MRDIQELRARLAEIAKIPDGEWMRSLNERKRSELDFHDRHRDTSKAKDLDADTYDRIYGNVKYYGATELSVRYLETWIARHARGRVFLDYACGNGEDAIRAAKAGAALAIGIDISSVSVENARRSAAAQGVSENTCYVQADAENTHLPDGSVDVIMCSGMLHHLDLSCAFPELCRILAPGGRILAHEALNCNPVIQWYRDRTPGMRTEWEKEHILGLKDLDYARRFFDLGEVRFWHITSILGAHAGPLMPLFNGVDRVLTRIPLVQRMAWMFSFELLSKKAP
jgi:ubiquinone/menaquinone biosynthesis C-methylase UbiE